MTQKEEKLCKEKPLVFNSDIKPQSLKDIVKLMIADKSPTYRIDKNGKPRRVGNFSARSAEDLYQVVRSYYPDISFEQCSNVLSACRTSGLFRSNYCNTCKRRVYEYNGWKSYNWVTKKENPNYFNNHFPDGLNIKFKVNEEAVCV